jgi:hypothetical protein
VGQVKKIKMKPLEKDKELLKTVHSKYIPSTFKSVDDYGLDGLDDEDYNVELENLNRKKEETVNKQKEVIDNTQKETDVILDPNLTDQEVAEIFDNEQNCSVYLQNYGIIELPTICENCDAVGSMIIVRNVEKPFIYMCNECKFVKSVSRSKCS